MSDSQPPSDSGLRSQREAVGLSQRELASRTGISQAKLSRVEAGAGSLTEGESTLVAVALAELMEPVVRDGPTYRPPSRRVRRAFVCAKCRRRVFLSGALDEDPEVWAVCAEHGPMLYQRNRPYRGEPTPADPRDVAYGERHGVDRA